MLDDVFGPLPALSGVKPVASMQPEAVGTRKVIDLDVPQASIRFGAAGLARTDPDFVAATVVNHILGGGVFSSRLFREVREKRGLAYSVSSHLAPFAHGPLHMGGTSTKNERAAESIAIIEQELTSLAHDGPNEQELATAKNYLIGSYALRLDTSAKLASQLVHIKAHGLGRSYLDERNGLVAAVSLDDAVRTAKRLYGAGDLLTVVVGRPVGL
jgi:zinc protease